MLSKFLLLLQRWNGWRLWAVLTFGIVVTVELIVSAMSLILKGEVAWDYLLTGFVAAIMAAPPSLVLLTFLLGELAGRQQESLSKSLLRVENRLTMALDAAQMTCWELDVVDGSLQYDPSTGCRRRLRRGICLAGWHMFIRRISPNSWRPTRRPFSRGRRALTVSTG